MHGSPYPREPFGRPVGVFDQLLEAAVPAIRRPGAFAAFWDVDAPATLDRVAADPQDPFRALVPAYDLVLTYGGSVDFFVQNVFNYPTLAECYRTAALDGINRLGRM